MPDHDTQPAAGDIWSLVPADPWRPAPLVLLLHSSGADHWQAHPVLDTAALACNQDGQILPGEHPDAGDPNGCWCALTGSDAIDVRSDALWRRWLRLDPAVTQQAQFFAAGQPSRLPRGSPLHPLLADPRISARDRQRYWVRLCLATTAERRMQPDLDKANAMTTDTASLNTKIQNILAARRQWLERDLSPLAQRWDAIRGALHAVRDAARQAAATKGSPTELRDLERSVDAWIAEQVHNVQGCIETARRRCLRETINIGVGGNSGQGKSTFLATATGLPNDVIPVSADALHATTAVRSQIYNTSADTVVNISFHTWDSFCKDVIGSHHAEAGLRALPLPSSPDEFPTLDYRASFNGQKANERESVIFQRLLRIQDGFAQHIKPWLGRGSVGKTLKDWQDQDGSITRFISFPLADDAAPGPHLAAKEARITCAFQASPIRGIGFIDLPGLSQVSAGLAGMHTNGIRDLCDVAVMLKKVHPQAKAEFDNEEVSTLTYIVNARDPIKERGHFTLILLNTMEGLQERAVQTQAAIERQLSSREGPTGYRFISGNARSLHDATGIMAQIVGHIAQHLESMDREVFKHAESVARKAQEEIAAGLARHAGVLGKAMPVIEGAETELLLRSTAMQQTLTADLVLYEEALAKADDTQWQEAVDRIYTQNVCPWIDGGCGYGSPESFAEKVAEECRAKGMPLKAALALRVDLKETWGNLEPDAERQILQVLERLVEVLRKHLGGLMHDLPPDPRAALGRLADMLENEIEVPARRIGGALRTLSGASLDFHLRMLPQVQDAFAPMTAEKLMKSNPDPTPAYWSQHLQNACHQASSDCKIGLMAFERHVAPVLRAMVDRLTEVFRARNSDVEFMKLTRAFKADIWPDLFGAAADGSSSQRYRHLVTTLRIAQQVIK